MLVRVLFVEDVETDAELAMRRMRQDGLQCTFTRVETEQAFAAALRANTHDIILSDFSLPQFDGMSALAMAARESPDTPFIFVSGTIGEERAIEALRCGAVDYILKSNLKRLAPAVNRALREAEQKSEREAQHRRIARLTRILEMLCGINTAVVRIRERLELLHEACRTAVTTGHYVTAMVSFIEPGTRTARPCTWAGESGEQMSSLVFSIAQSAEEDSSITGRVLRTGEVIVGDDKSTVALPLRVDGTTVGAITLTAQHSNCITDEELALLGEVAANLSFALQYFETESAVQFLSYFDSLTGLAKRVLFCERLAGRLSARQAEEPQPAVAVLDIEHLSIINDSYGRHAGDHLLQRVADRLRAASTLRASPTSGRTMSRSRSSRVWPAADRAARMPRHWCRTPKRDCARPRLRASNTSPAACGGAVPALAGGRSATPARRRELLAPATAPGLHRAGVGHCVGLDRGRLGLDLEITESLLIDPDSSQVHKLRALRNAGVRVAIDDFGTGYSSLSRLSDLPVDTLKIDRSFIDGLPGDRACARLVPTVINLARAFESTARSRRRRKYRFAPHAKANTSASKSRTMVLAST